MDFRGVQPGNNAKAQSRKEGFMARTQVKAITTVNELRFVEHDGTEVRAIKPAEVFSVGNSIGGYIALPVEGSGGARWGIIRITGGEKDRLRQARRDSNVTINGLSMYERELSYIIGREPERLVTNGRQYLLATSSGSARRGIVHVYRPPLDEKDPIKRVLREERLGLSLLERVGDDPLDIGWSWYDQQHCPNGRATTSWLFDGIQEVTSEEVTNNPRGYFRGGKRGTSRIMGGTYLIRLDYGRSVNGTQFQEVGHVMVRPGCDPMKLKEALNSYTKCW